MSIAQFIFYMSYFKTKLKIQLGITNSTGPRKTKKNENGFFIRPLGTDKNRKNVLSTEKLDKHCRWNLDGKSTKKRTQYTWWPCYEDVNDKETLQWWLIYYKN